MGKTLNVQSDRPSRTDRLGHDRHVKIISDMVSDPEFRTPFCIGIFGAWGTGKTSFMGQIRQRLSEAETMPAMVPVWFNPWRYQKEPHLIIPFLKTIENDVRKYRSETRGKTDRIVDVLRDFGQKAGDVAAAMAYGTSHEFNLGLWKGRFEADKAAAREEELKDRRARFEDSGGPDLSSIYYDAMSALRDAVDERVFRVAVFIDDLDRCLPGPAVELLEAIKLFLDIPGYLFFIGIDRDVVCRGIRHLYRHLDRDGDNRTETVSPEDYLEKMIQLPIELPPIEPGKKIAYIESLFGGDDFFVPHAPLVAAAVGDNPRTLKRFVNLLVYTHRVAEEIRDRIEKDEKESEENRALIAEHFIPIQYIKWTAIVFRFQDVYRIVRGAPERLLEFQEQALKKKEKGADEADSGKGSSEDLHPALREILATEPLFPSSKWLVDKFVYLARSAPVAIKADAANAGVRRHLKPGDMVTVRAGSFLFGEDRKEEKIDYDFEIDAFPVTQRQYKEFVDATGHREPEAGDDFQKSYGWDKAEKTYPKGKADHPVVLVSQGDAEAYCQWRSQQDGRKYRLPTEREWEKAARGTEGAEYPWGDWAENRCNTEESGIGGTTEVPRYPEGESPYGCQDMAGNVWEWTSSFLDEDKNFYVLKGGSWDNPRDIARCAARDGGLRPGGRSDGVGFRCVRTKS